MKTTTTAALTLLIIVPVSPVVWAEGLPPRSQWVASASSGGDPALAPKLAIDGDMTTRWSSDFADPQWLQIDLGTSATVCGVTIYWETAYGSRYDVLLSNGGDDWTTVYSTDRGDGGVDDIYFTPTQARYVRVLGHKRGTGWGYSVFELAIKGTDQQVSVKVAPAGQSDVAALFDGDPQTTWTTPSPEGATLTIDFKVIKPLAGLRIDWGADRAKQIALSASTDGQHWSRLDAPPFGGEQFDVLMHDRIDARYLKLALSEPAGTKPIEIAELSLADLSTSGNLLAVYRIAAQTAPPGAYPVQLLDQQVYWTVVGLPTDPEESLFDEYGNLEPRSGGCMLQPYVFTGGRLYTAPGSDRVEQAMVNGRLPLPSVCWWAAGMPVDVAALTRGELGSSVTYVRYRITNATTTPQEGLLLLAVRPMQINPPWQHGGLSEIHDLALRDGGNATTVEIDRQPTFIGMPAADRCGARPFRRGDVGRDIMEGQVPSAREVHDDRGLASGALAYTFELAPGESRSVVVAAPLSGALDDAYRFRALGDDLGDSFQRALSQQTAFWRQRLAGPIIDLPDAGVADMLVAQIAYILINQDGPAIQPGSRNYDRSWMRDGSSSMAALLRMGRFDDARRWLAWYAARVEPDGLVPPILTTDGRVYTGYGSNIEWDSQGEFLYALAEYYRFTGDRAFLADHFDTAVAALGFLERLRKRTESPGYLADAEAPERFRGVLPPSISHEGYNPPVHSNWDNFFGLKGLKDAAFIAKVLGHADVASEAAAEHKSFEASLKRSIDATIRHFDIGFIPGCADKGDFDATSTAIALYPCEEAGILDEQVLRATFDQYYGDLIKRTEPGWQGQFTPYELRSIAAFVKLGEPKKANELLEYMMTCRRPKAWNQLGEVVHSEYRKNAYVGDLPHTWVGAEYVNAVRAMLVLEQGDEIHLLPGVLPRWVAEAPGVRIKGLPTYFGVLDLIARVMDGEWRIEIGGAAAPPGGYVLHVNTPQAPRVVVVDGRPAEMGGDDRINLPPTARQVRMVWE